MSLWNEEKRGNLFYLNETALIVCSGADECLQQSENIGLIMNKMAKI